jgi:hypothetical protein
MRWAQTLMAQAGQPRLTARRLTLLAQRERRRWRRVWPLKAALTPEALTALQPRLLWALRMLAAGPEPSQRMRWPAVEHLAVTRPQSQMENLRNCRLLEQ